MFHKNRVSTRKKRTRSKRASRGGKSLKIRLSSRDKVNRSGLIPNYIWFRGGKENENNAELSQAEKNTGLSQAEKTH